jgi:hypothetical protein
LIHIKHRFCKETVELSKGTSAKKGGFDADVIFCNESWSVETYSAPAANVREAI